MRQMNAKLVRTTGLRLKFYERVFFVLINDAVFGDCFAPLVGNHKSSWFFEIPCKWNIDNGVTNFWMADGYGVVSFMCLAFLELFLQERFCFGVFCKDNDAGGAAVEAVNDFAKLL